MLVIQEVIYAFYLLSEVVGPRFFFLWFNDNQWDQIGWLGDWTMGNFSKPVATISLSKSPGFLGNFCKDVKIFSFSSEIIFGQLLWTFGDFLLVTLMTTCPDNKTDWGWQWIPKLQIRDNFDDV